MNLKEQRSHVGFLKALLYRCYWWHITYQSLDVPEFPPAQHKKDRSDYTRPNKWNVEDYFDSMNLSKEWLLKCHDLSTKHWIVSDLDQPLNYYFSIKPPEQHLLCVSVLPVPGAEHLRAANQTLSEVRKTWQLLHVHSVSVLKIVRTLCLLIGYQTPSQSVPVQGSFEGGKPFGYCRGSRHRNVGVWMKIELLFLQFFHLILGCLESVSAHNLFVCLGQDPKVYQSHFYSSFSFLKKIFQCFFGILTDSEKKWSK